MLDLTRIVSALRTTRQQLVEQLLAVDKAIAALESTQPAEVEPPTVDDAPPPEDIATVDEPVALTILKPKRTLADSHREAMATGRRKARDAKEVAAGLAREMPDDTFVPALSSRGGNQPPRLVKKPRRR